LELQTAIALRNPRTSVVGVLLTVAICAALILGALGGYLIRAATETYSPPPPARAVCSTGSHVEVWYTAHTWGCVAD
jgi:hypothetical protein